MQLLITYIFYNNIVKNMKTIFGNLPEVYYNMFMHESCNLFALYLYIYMSNDGLNVSIHDLYVNGEYYHTVVEYENKYIDILGFHKIDDIYKIVQLLKNLCF